MSYESFEKAQKNLEAEKKKVVLQFKELLNEHLLDVTKNTQYKKLRWTQYTPYFNDGSPCVFGVNLPDLYCKEGTVSHGLYSVEKSKNWYYYPWDNVVQESLPPEVRKLEKLFTELEPWYFQEAFDDHVEVTFDGKSYKVVGYSHE